MSDTARLRMNVQAMEGEIARLSKEREELREALMRIRHAVRNDHPLHALEIADTALANLNKPASGE